MVLEPRERVDRRAARRVDLQVEVRACHVAGRTDATDDLTGRHLLPHAHRDRGLVAVPQLRTVVEKEHGAVAVRAGPARLLDGRRVDRLERRAGRRGEVEPRVVPGGPHRATVAEVRGEGVGGDGEGVAAGEFREALRLRLRLRLGLRPGLRRRFLLLLLVRGLLLRLRGVVGGGLRRDRLGLFAGRTVRAVGLILGLREDAGAQRLARVGGALLAVGVAEPGVGERRGGGVGGELFGRVALGVGDERADAGERLGVRQHLLELPGHLRDLLRQRELHRRLLLRRGDTARADRSEHPDSEHGRAAGESAALLGDPVPAAHGPERFLCRVPLAARLGSTAPVRAESDGARVDVHRGGVTRGGRVRGGGGVGPVRQARGGPVRLGGTVRLRRGGPVGLRGDGPVRLGGDGGPVGRAGDGGRGLGRQRTAGGEHAGGEGARAGGRRVGRHEGDSPFLPSRLPG
ncbi:putative peptidase [Streptomyces sp. Tu6071]|nr:putative peptidase [Streptomyces sp. Tu6071]